MGRYEAIVAGNSWLRMLRLPRSAEVVTIGFQTWNVWNEAVSASIYDGYAWDMHCEELKILKIAMDDVTTTHINS